MTSPDDAYLQRLCESYTEEEVEEIQRYLADWGKGTYVSVAQSVLDHARRKVVDPLKYLRQASSFNKKGARRIPSKGYRRDGSVIYRKGRQYLIVRPDDYGTEKIVTFGTLNE